jgi:hypothetical protein
MSEEKQPTAETGADKLVENPQTTAATEVVPPSRPPLQPKDGVDGDALS